ncbi:MAG: glycosyltransferase [Saprospiraceae bacterium]|nr:glycosyltransferase [Saprospiraceae bacterium]
MIVARDAGETLYRCLSSLSSFPEVVVLIDEATKDSTLEICQQFSQVKTHYTQFLGFGKIKQKAVALATHPWVLSIDADEEVSDAMLEEINNLKLDEGTVYAIHRHNHYQHRHIDACGWNNDYPIRLFNKNITNFDDAAIHEAVVSTKTEILKLKGPILHFPYKDEAGLRQKAVRYAELYSRQNYRKKSASPLKAWWKSAFTFFKDFFLRKGWLYGSDGFTIAKFNALGSRLKYQYLGELNQQMGITLIISTYNRPDALARVLESVVNQTYPPAQVIIADDGSTEETARVVEHYKIRLPQLIHVWHEDTGFRLAGIRNKALKEVNQAFVSMVDGDMVLHKDFLYSLFLHAKKGWYYQGKRVLLDKKNTEKVLQDASYQLGFFTPGITNRFNTLSFLFLSRLISRQEKTIRGVKGCSMHFWMEDALRVNGFNEAFIGWGREDSEFVCRLLNAGIKRKNIALAAVAWHLYHPEASRNMLPENDAILEKCIKEKHTFTTTGLNP